MISGKRGRMTLKNASKLTLDGLTILSGSQLQQQ
jgi:hypothetical protein